MFGYSAESISPLLPFLFLSILLIENAIASINTIRTIIVIIIYLKFIIWIIFVWYLLRSVVINGFTAFAKIVVPFSPNFENYQFISTARTTFRAYIAITFI